MLSYKNGEYPLSLLIHRGGNIYLTPSLNARWNEMVRLALEKYRVRLYITGDIDGLGGWNGYRPLLPQRRYKAHYGPKAAAAGYSSHGGKYQGKEVFALDIANVDALAPGNPSLAHARLTALAKAVGLTVNFVTPTEWWHVGDFNNAWSAPTFGQITVNPGTTNQPLKEALSMATQFITTDKNSGKPISDANRRGAHVNTDSGFVCEVSYFTLGDADSWAKAYGQPIALRLTDSAFDKYVAETRAVARRS